MNRNEQPLPDTAQAGHLVVALAGTDLYGDGERPDLGRALALATRIVVLQPAAIDRLPPQHRRKCAGLLHPFTA